MLESVANQYRKYVEVAVQSLTDEESVKVKTLYPPWKSYLGKTITVNTKIYYNGKLYKVLQEHTVQDNWVPGIGTESLYSEIDEIHSGTIEDPIPYNNNMELEFGKYYIQNGIIYLCNRNTEIPVYNNLSDLVGIYVEVAN